MEELWDIYDKNGNFTGIKKTRNDILLEGEYHLSASLWILNSDDKLLIQKRSSTKRIAPNKWGITGGSVRAGESSKKACIREVFEEIGLELSINEIKLLSRSFGKDNIYDDYIIEKNFPLNKLVLQKTEVQDVKWSAFDEIVDLFHTGQFLFDDINELSKVKDFINQKNKIDL